MTIFESGYSGFQYEPTSVFTRIRALATAEFGRIFKTKKGVILFIFCVVYAVVMLVLVHIFVDGMQRLTPRMSPFEPEFYLGHSVEEGVLTMLLLTSIVSVRSIAGDKNVNALEIYWTRGISPWQYFFGKWLGSFVLLAVVYIGGPLVAWLYGWLSAPDSKFFDTTIEFFPAILLAITVKCGLISFFAVGFSGIVGTPNAATFLWLFVNMGSDALVGLLVALTRRSARFAPEEGDDYIWYEALCPWEAIKRIDHSIVGLRQGNDYPVWIAWACLGVLAVFVLSRLRRNLRTTEAME